MNRVCSIFSQWLQLFSRVEFEAAVQPHKAERHGRGFTGWGHFVAMLFGQLVGPIACERFANRRCPWPGNALPGACRNSRCQRCNIPQRHPFFQPYRR
jgi:hypothetical protein